MKLVQVPLVVAAFFTISASFHISPPSIRYDHERLCDRVHESIPSAGDNVVSTTQRSHHVVSLRLILSRKGHTNPNIRKDYGKCGYGNDPQTGDPKKHSRRWRRRSVPPPPPPPDELTPREQRMESPNPTMKEMGWVLSPKQVEAYVEHWRAGKKFKATLYRKTRGDILSTEEEEQFKADRLGYNEARRLEEYVKADLVKNKRARARLVESYEKRLRDSAKHYSNTRKRMKELKDLIDNDLASPDEVTEQYSNTKNRMKELKDLIDNDMASPDEVAEYEELLSDAQARKAEYEKLLSQAQARKERDIKASARRRTELNNRMKVLEQLKNPTEAERAEYRDMVATREKELARQKEYTKMWRAEKEITYNERTEALELRIRDQVATPAERTEYEDLLARRKDELERQNEYSKKWYANNKAYSKRIEELEPRFRNQVATPAERAEYEMMVARREDAREESQRKADRKRADKIRMQELERRINGDRVATPAEQAEYNELSAEFQRANKVRKAGREKRKTASKNRMEELERLMNDDPTDAERAEYEARKAKLQADRDSVAEKMRKSRAKTKNRMKELESLMDDHSTDADRAEYEAMKAKIQKDRDAKALRRAKKEVEKAGGTPSTGTASEKIDKTDGNQPLQSSTNPLLQKVDSFLNRLGGLLPKQRPWNLPPPVPGVLPPMPVPLRAIL
ncbi:MAG: hypothetical protein M1816_007967 [Peltula sp. TS41687]|nr:MAG: hypothetical protein M1816_007967 [Peltula sp. TS41687]